MGVCRYIHMQGDKEIDAWSLAEIEAEFVRIFTIS